MTKNERIKLKHIRINSQKVNDLADLIINNRLSPRSFLDEFKFNSLTDRLNFLLIFSSINFCFWGDPKWSYKVDNSKITGTRAILQRLYEVFYSDTKDLSAANLIQLDREKFDSLFPNSELLNLVNQRISNLNELGYILNKHGDGYLLEKLDEAESYEELQNSIEKDLPNFKDQVKLEGKTIKFNKRLQVLAYSIHKILPKKAKLYGVEIFTGFADYRVPQLIREFQLITYDSELSNRIDSKKLISKNSREEIEIRLAVIYVIEDIQRIINNKFIAPEIDSILWNLAKDKSDSMKPHHRTLTQHY